MYGLKTVSLCVTIYSLGLRFKNVYFMTYFLGPLSSILSGVLHGQ